MQRYEYKVIPAPRRGTKSREAKSTEDRFALTLTTLMNDQGREGWEYQRAETLPCDERSGFTKIKTTEQIMLVFRRPLSAAAASLAPGLVAVASAGPPADGPAMFRPLAAEPATPRLGPAVEPEPGPAPAVGRAE